MWDLILNCLNILDINDEEAYGLWSILAAIYHLGYAGVKQGREYEHVQCRACTCSTYILSLFMSFDFVYLL